MVCPNCGQTFEGDRCPNCGRPAGGSTANRILAVVVAVFLVLPLGLFGACSAYVGIGGIFDPRHMDGFWIVGAVAAAIAIPATIGLGILVRNLWRG